MFRSISFALAASALFITIGAQAAGEPPGASGAKSEQASQPLAISTPHTLLKTYLETDSKRKQLQAGEFTEIGQAVNINCANAGGCTIVGNMNAQLDAVEGSQNPVAICLTIDGENANCPFNSIVPPGNGFFILSYQTFAEVGQGNHTVQMSLYSTIDTKMRRWNKAFQLYNP